MQTFDIRVSENFCYEKRARKAKEIFENKDVKISSYQASVQEVNGLRIDIGMYLMRWKAQEKREKNICDVRLHN